MGIEMGVFLTFGGSLILLFLLGKALLVPLKYILRLMFNSLLGAVVLLVINFFGANFGVLIPFNIINAVVVGVLGLPGAVMLLILCN